MKVDIYKNLTKKCYSIRSREKKSYGKVIEHSKDIILKDVQFIVGEKGRERVIQEKRKNVHAYARGTYLSTTALPLQESWLPKAFVSIKYDPYKYSYFYREDTLEPVYKAKMLYCTKSGIWAQL